MKGFVLTTWKHLAVILIILAVLAPTSYAAENKANFTDNGDGTITDNVTGIMWQKGGDGIKRDWHTAISYCTGLSLGGHNDWSLPSAKNLQSIVDYRKFSPAKDMQYFPSTQSWSSSYWSSTTFDKDTSVAWYLIFDVGPIPTVSSKTYQYYARCVRPGGK